MGVLKVKTADGFVPAGAALSLIGTVGGEKIPTYHYAEAARVAENILAFKRTHANSLIFGAVSDSHVAHDNESYEANTKASIRHAAFALETVGAMVGCDFIVNLGDNCWENGIDTDTAYAGAKYAVDSLKDAFARLTAYSIPGNHDKSDDTQKLFALVGAVNEFDEYGATQIRGYGYKDYTDKKVRVICLNSVDYLYASGGYAMSYEQKDFLMRSLDLSGKADVAEWQILILSHIPVDFNYGDYNTYADLQTILSAYVNGTTASVKVNSSYSLNEDPTQYATYDAGVLFYDYSVGNNEAKIIANIHGHVHTDAYGMMANGILRMATPNACFYLGKTESYPNYGDYSIDTAISRTEGTATDACAVFYCIDLTEQSITAFAYGAGSDRAASYATTEDGGSEDGGEEEVTYTNLFSAEDADFVDGYRFSSSGGNTSGADAFLSGYIAAVSGDVIRVRCPGGNYADGTGNNLRCICTYNSGKTNISCKYPADVIIDADGLGFSYTITDSACAYVRVSGHPAGNYSGFIVTKNEEITQ